MAEFSVVMKQAQRMCAAYESRCERCPLGQSDGCPFDFFRHYMESFDFSEVERIVMDWAEKHPEPKYPSWMEWYKMNFPNASLLVQPCRFMSKEALKCMNTTCDACREQPIPADISEKLHIEPIGGSSGA